MKKVIVKVANLKWDENLYTEHNGYEVMPGLHVYQDEYDQWQIVTAIGGHGVNKHEFDIGGFRTRTLAVECLKKSGFFKLNCNKHMKEWIFSDEHLTALIKLDKLCEKYNHYNWDFYTPRPINPVVTT